MSTPYIGEIFIFTFNFAPRGYAFCNGQLISSSQNSALYAILGTTYGGNGQTTFGLPNLQSRLPVHVGSGPGLSPYVLGQVGGTATVALSQSNLPIHSHTIGNSVAVTATTSNPVNAYLAQASSGTPYAAAAGAAMGGAKASAPVLASVGGGAAHNNLMPYQCLNFCIALQGIFPTIN